jgi:hypothetical protein
MSEVTEMDPLVPTGTPPNVDFCLEGVVPGSDLRRAARLAILHPLAARLEQEALHVSRLGFGQCGGQ